MEVVCKLILIVFSSIYVVPIASLNLLGIFPLTGKSHFLAFELLMKGLVDKGHNVTILGYFPLESTKNYRFISVADSLQSISEHANLYDLTKIDSASRWSMYTIFLFLDTFGQKSCEMLFESLNLQNFLKENNKFDIAVTEFFNSDCSLAIVEKFKCPVIRVHSTTMMPWTHTRYSNPVNPAYIPSNFLPISDKIAFLAKVENLLISQIQNIYFHTKMIKSNNDIVEKYFGKLTSSLSDAIYNDSLLLINTHFTLNLPRPLVPNVVEVGGIHIGKIRPLPKVSSFSFSI